MLELILGNVWSFVAAAGAIIAAVLGIYAKGRKDGGASRKIRDLETERKTRDAMDNVDIDDIGSADDLLHERLHNALKRFDM